MVRGVTSDLQTKRISLIHKRLAAVQKNEQLSMREWPLDSAPVGSAYRYFRSYTADVGRFSEVDGVMGKLWLF